MEASQFVGAAKVVETPVTATVTATITAEASHELEERNEISSLGSCLDKYWTEQLNKISSWGSSLDRYWTGAAKADIELSWSCSDGSWTGTVEQYIW